tara:strand:- start:788 stop:1579 length:792 start_codon:yes stop_codon:yes gene_type:complete
MKIIDSNLILELKSYLDDHKEIIIIIGIILFIVFLYFKDTNKLDKKISVIILSYNRPHNLEKSLPILNDYKNIDEILVLHGHPDHYKNFQFNKVYNFKDYELNKKYGAARRWFHTDKCKNDIILFLDDDLLPSEKLVDNLLNKLLEEYTRNTIYGKYKRICNEKGYNSKSNNHYDTILTPVLMTKKSTVSNYLKSDLFKEYKKWLIKHHGNCEDLGFNMFIRKVYKEKPEYVSGDYEELDKENGYSSMDNHLKIRNNFCKKYS